MEGPYRTLVCSGDPVRLTALQVAAEEHGLTVVGVANNAAELLPLAEHDPIHAVILEQELVGMPGVEATEILRRREPAPEVVVITVDPALRERAHELGAFEVVPRGDTDFLDHILDEVRELLETGERRKSSDRRAGRDRRVRQDWSKVTSERRRGTDRRHAGRRGTESDEGGATPTPET